MIATIQNVFPSCRVDTHIETALLEEGDTGSVCARILDKYTAQIRPAIVRANPVMKTAGVPSSELMIGDNKSFVIVASRAHEMLSASAKAISLPEKT